MSASEHTMDEIEFEVMEVSEMDKSLLMSLLNEPNEEVEADNATLESVTKSSENEIEPEFMNMGNPSLTVEDYQSEDIAVLEEYQHDMDNFDWINDMDIDYSSVTSSLSDDDDDDDQMGINNWYMGCTFRDDIEAGMIEFGGLRDYDSELYYGVHQLEEQGGYNSSLWQETYDSVVYG